MPNQTARQRDAALAKFEERFAKVHGEDTLRSGTAFRPYQVIPTGSLATDLAMGVGGYVLGRTTEIYGIDGIGKSSLLIQGVREAQERYPERLVFWTDMEQSADEPWFASHGVDLARLRIYRPKSAEDVADAVKDAIRSGLFSMVALDSIGAMIPEAEKEKDADEATVGLQAKIVTRMVKIATVEAMQTSTAFIVINQLRANISGFGKATTTGGGWALRYCSTHKLELRRAGEGLSVQMDGVKQEVGHEVAVMVERNRVAPPKKRAQFTFIHTPSDKYGPVGIDKADEAATVGLKTRVILQEAGGYYTIPGTGERVRGRDKMVEALRADSSLVETVRSMALDRVADAIVTGVDAEPEIDQVSEDTDGIAFRKASDIEES
jgi:recombination protein RecA